MRKVLVTTYQTDDGHRRWYQRSNDPYQVIEREGYFHQFSQEGDEGSISPVAIIEYNDGSLESVYLQNVSFISPWGS